MDILMDSDIMDVIEAALEVDIAVRLNERMIIKKVLKFIKKFPKKGFIFLFKIYIKKKIIRDNMLLVKYLIKGIKKLFKINTKN